MQLKTLAVVLLIVFFGLTSRFFTFQNSHPDSDELFELRNMQSIKPVAILSNKTFYGDHTSFPGEYLIHYLPMVALNLFNNPAKIDIEGGKLQGLTKTSFWILAIPKILIMLLSIVLFYILSASYLKTTLGFVIAFSLFMFNGHMIYHAFSLRPYGILPELAIINLFLAMHTSKKEYFFILQGCVIFFTCIYHAYGILIALLPILYFRRERYRDLLWFILPAIAVWVYYASYSTFGLAPNKVQSVVDTFQFIKKENFLPGIVDAFFGTSILTAAIIPLVLIGLNYIKKTHIYFFMTFILLPLALIIAVDIKTQYWIHPRQFIWIIPAFALWCGMLTERIFKNEAQTF